jgi:penicillin amidase
VATANNRTVGAGYPHVVGHDFAHGCRVHRIEEVLRELPIADAAAMHVLQLDTRAPLHARYRDVALAALAVPAGVLDPDLAAVRALLQAWDGRAEPGSRAMSVVDLFRRNLARACLGPIVAPCRAHDERFVYAWGNLDTPLEQIVTARSPELLPDPTRHADWPAFLRSCLLESVRAWRAQGGLPWGELNRASIVHPLAAMLRPLGRLVGMPPDKSGGCQHCVRVSTPRFGATTRMIVVLDDPQDSTMEMPGGQSEHPLSANFSDQHGSWIAGERRPFAPGPAVRRTVLSPAGGAG